MNRHLTQYELKLLNIEKWEGYTYKINDLNEIWTMTNMGHESQILNDCKLKYNKILGWELSDE